MRKIYFSGILHVLLHFFGQLLEREDKLLSFLLTLIGKRKVMNASLVFL